MLKHVQRGSAGLKWLLGLATAFFTGVAKAVTAPTWFPEGWKPLFPWVVKNQFWLLTCPLVAVVALQFVEKRIEHRLHRRAREKQLKRLMEELLQRLRERFIPPRLRRDPPPFHRLTLFRANKERERLEIVARSAEATRGSTTCWQIDPDDQSKCKGVAGVAWYFDTIIVVPDPGEPELPNVSGPCTEAEIEDYARRCFVPAASIREHRWAARSFAAMSIRVDGRRWGALVLDSVSPRGAQQRIIAQMAFAADMLGDIIRAWGDR
jgi:hypothetical protein